MDKDGDENNSEDDDISNYSLRESLSRSSSLIEEQQQQSLCELHRLAMADEETQRMEIAPLDETQLFELHGLESSPATLEDGKALGGVSDCEVVAESSTPAASATSSYSNEHRQLSVLLAAVKMKISDKFLAHISSCFQFSIVQPCSVFSMVMDKLEQQRH